LLIETEGFDKSDTSGSAYVTHNSQGSLPLDASPSSPAPPTNLYLFLPPFITTGRVSKKKVGKKPFFHFGLVFIFYQSRVS
jgi:hypothetical protein